MPNTPRKAKLLIAVNIIFQLSSKFLNGKNKQNFIYDVSPEASKS